MKDIAGFCGFTEGYAKLRETLGGAGEARWSCPACVLSGPETVERPLGTVRYAAAFSGELGDVRSIHRFLRARGHKLTAHSDAEAALYAYMEYGPQTAERLSGRFSLVLWDGLKQQFFACRVGTGTEKLYYVNYDGALAVSSRQDLLSTPEEGASPVEIAPGGWLVRDRSGLKLGAAH